MKSQFEAAVKKMYSQQDASNGPNKKQEFTNLSISKVPKLSPLGELSLQKRVFFAETKASLGFSRGSTINEGNQHLKTSDNNSVDPNSETRRCWDSKVNISFTSHHNEIPTSNTNTPDFLYGDPIKNSESRIDNFDSFQIMNKTNKVDGEESKGKGLFPDLSPENNMTASFGESCFYDGNPRLRNNSASSQNPDGTDDINQESYVRQVACDVSALRKGQTLVDYLAADEIHQIRTSRRHYEENDGNWAITCKNTECVIF